MRWTEEVELIEEEMRRTKQFLTWQAGWWESQVTPPSLRMSDLVEGINAYAHRQASIRRRMHDYCAQAWGCVRAWVCLGQAAGSLDTRVADVRDDESDMPSLTTVSDSTVSLEAFMGEDLQDVADVEIALEDFD